MNFEDIIKQIDGYEVELPANDWEILSQKLNKKRRKTTLLFWYAAAAGVALLIGVGVTFFALQSTKNSQIYSDDILENQNENSIQKVENDIEETQINVNHNHNSTKNNSTFFAEKQIEKAQNTLQENHENSIGTSNNNNFAVSDTKKQPETRHISIEEAEKLMREKENPQTENLYTETSAGHRYYASVSASMSPTNFGKTETTPKKSLIPSVSQSAAIMSTSYFKTKYDLPFTVCFSIGIPIAKRLHINTGLQYTYIHSKTEEFGNVDNGLISKDDKVLHYLGIPLMLSYEIINRNVFRLYVSGGGAAEKGLLETHNQKVFRELNQESVFVPTDKNKSIPGFQFSLNANIGASISLFKGLNLYVEPGFAWYIPNMQRPQPTSIRTQRPFFVNITAGVRFNFDKK